MVAKSPFTILAAAKNAREVLVTEFTKVKTATADETNAVGFISLSVLLEAYNFEF